MIQNIAIEKLLPHPQNPRKDLGDLDELVESIKANGVLQNLTVVPLESDGESYKVIIGHRRCSAALKAGLKEVPCAVVEMDEKTQVGTMLLENIQRSDLSVYEQAQGFQMMIDLGDTVQGISEKTGFSKTTVRKRTQLMELDPGKFKAAADKGATLMDFEKMNRIKDVERRNKVLEYFGTSNYDYKLRAAFDEEKKETKLAEYRKVLETFATEINKVEHSMMQRVHCYSLYYDETIKVPEDADTVKYYYKVDYTVDLYKQGNQTEEDAREKEKRRLMNEKQEKLKEISNRAKQMRVDFVKTYSKSKDNYRRLLALFLKTSVDSYCNLTPGSFAKLFEISNEENEYDRQEVLRRIEEEPERALLFAAYSGMDRYHTYYDYNGHYSECETLDQLYNFLTELGYQMSDEEKALRDGTHELFVKAAEEEQ